jgi:hypothetical protein
VIFQSFREKGRAADRDWRSYIFGWRDLAIASGGSVELRLTAKEK